jgi:hypothetical protein
MTFASCEQIQATAQASLGLTRTMRIEKLIRNFSDNCSDLLVSFVVQLSYQPDLVVLYNTEQIAKARGTPVRYHRNTSW